MKELLDKLQLNEVICYNCKLDDSACEDCTMEVDTKQGIISKFAKLEAENKRLKLENSRLVERLVDVTEPGSIGAFAARDNWMVKAEQAENSLAMAIEEIDRLKKDMLVEENDLVLAETQLLCIEQILNGDKMDFLTSSFPVAQAVHELRQQALSGQKAVEAMNQIIQANKSIDCVADFTASVVSIIREYQEAVCRKAEVKE